MDEEIYGAINIDKTVLASLKSQVWNAWDTLKPAFCSGLLLTLGQEGDMLHQDVQDSRWIYGSETRVSCFRNYANFLPCSSKLDSQMYLWVIDIQDVFLNKKDIVNLRFVPRSTCKSQLSARSGWNTVKVWTKALGCRYVGSSKAGFLVWGLLCIRWFLGTVFFRYSLANPALNPLASNM